MVHLVPGLALAACELRDDRTPRPRCTLARRAGERDTGGARGGRAVACGRVWVTRAPSGDSAAGRYRSGPTLNPLRFREHCRHVACSCASPGTRLSIERLRAGARLRRTLLALRPVGLDEPLAEDDAVEAAGAAARAHGLREAYWVVNR